MSLAAIDDRLTVSRDQKKSRLASPSRLTVSPFALLTSALLALAVWMPAPVEAGGFYLAERGTRPLGRGGAFVAGVDDPHSLWLNPAGLSYSGDQLLIDATETLFAVDYTRIDSGGNVLPTVNGHHAYLPIPTIAGSYSFDELPELTFGLGLFAPNASLTEWPQSIDVNGVENPAPQRYSLLSLQGSLLSSIALGAAWKPIPELSIGLATHLLFGNFDARVALSACEGVICSFPEDPEYDAIAQISLPVFFPFFVLGAVVDLDIVRIGFSISTAYNLEGSALLRVRPPSAAAFDGAQVVNRRAGCNYQDPMDPCRGDTRADVQLEFPWVMRLGVEVRPVPELRLEAAVVWETWSVQDEARIRPRDVWIEDALGGALDYQVGPMSIPRNMNDTVSIRLGGEYTVDNTVTIRAGGYWENGAFSDQYLSALTIDSDKVVMGGGVGIHVSDEVIIDLAAGYVWMASRSVRDSLVPQPNPIRPPVAANEVVYVGNGDYSMGAPYFGLGVRWRSDAGRIGPPVVEEEEEPSEEETIEEPSSEEPEADEASSDPATDAEATPEPTPEPEQTEAEEEEPEPPARRRRRSR